MRLSSYTIASKCADISDIDSGILELRRILDNAASRSKLPGYVFARYDKLCLKKERLSRYWYLDNWWGQKRYFKSIRAAQLAAKDETGIAVTLYDSKKPGWSKTLVCSGYTPS
jgi:hypothetical protein